MARRSSKARRRPKVRPQGVLELNARGFGFVKTAEGEFFIPASKVNGAFPGDLVEVTRLSSGESRGKNPYARKPTARVVKVLMRSRDTFVGRYEVAEPFGVVVPEDPSIPYDIFTLRREAPQAKDGDVVEVRIIDFPSRNSAATGTIVRVLGSEENVDVNIDLIIAEQQFETEFSEGALEEAAACTLDVDQAYAEGYRDLTGKFIFTIDPVDARDFDDAVSLEKEGDLFRLGVHIADVSRFVSYGTSLDLDARRRATSVYLVDRVLPMLPEQLSNDLCSLVPGKPRCTISVEALLSADGKVQSYEVFPSVIRSSARLSYDQAQALLDCMNEESGEDALSDYAQGKDGEDALLARAVDAISSCEVPQGALALAPSTIEKLLPRIVGLDRLAKALFTRRKKDGCMDFDRVEAKVRLDADKRPLEICYRRKTDATELIEEAMILANHLVAEWLLSKNLPCVFRVHDAPDGQALHALYVIIREFPLFKDIDKRLFCDGNPQTLQEVLERVKGHPLQELVNTLLLRSMKRAVYRATQDPHYGLALDTYCHFTSPIRRYPDLLVHRMLKEDFFGHTACYEAQKNALPWMAEHSSTMERKAEKAARQSQLVKIVEYLQAYVGTTFDGVISSVSTFGVVVRLDNTATGMLAVEELGDEYFSFDPARQVLNGTSTGRVYRLGQRIKVVLVDADPRKRDLTFKLAPEERFDARLQKRWV